jgi:hypothetical protein
MLNIGLQVKKNSFIITSRKAHCLQLPLSANAPVYPIIHRYNTNTLCFVNLIVGLYFGFFFKLPALMDNKLKRKTLLNLSNLEFN